MLTVPFYATLGVVLSLLLLDVSSAYFDTNEAIQKRMNEGVLPSKDDILISRLVGQDGTDSLTSVSAAALDFTKNFIESWNSFKSPAMNMTRSTAIQGGTQGPNALSPDLDKINAIVSAFSSKALATTARLSKLHNDKENRELTSPPPFTCETLPLTYSPDLVCSGVVDYPFLVPYGSTADDLDQAARLIAKAALPLLSTSCLSDMKRLLCSRLYLRCVDNVVPTDPTTYLNDNGIILPYHRPCKSICDAVTYTGTSCKGMLEALQIAPLFAPCSSFEFDASNNAAVCNAMTSTNGKQLVADPVEPYVGNICKGIATSYYVAAPVFDPKVAPLLPPFVAQSMNEAFLSAAEAMVPRFLEQSCLQIQREISCALSFMPPFESDQFIPLFGNPLYFPQFPAARLCKAYNDKCASLNAIVPSLVLNCSSVVQLGNVAVNLYPENPQLLFSMPIASGQSLDVIVPPNELEDVTTVIDTQCPYGFTPYEQGDDEPDGITPIFGCAMNCPAPIYTVAEYIWMHKVDVAFYSIMFSFLTLAGINLYATRRKRVNLIFVGIWSFSWVISLLCLVNSITTMMSGGDLLSNSCKNKFTAFTATNLIGNSRGQWCASYASAMGFLQNIDNALLLAALNELFFRIIYEMKDITWANRINIGFFLTVYMLQFIFQFTLTPKLDLTSSGNCSWTITDPFRPLLSFFAMNLPTLIFNVYNFPCILLVTRKLWYTFTNANRQLSSKGGSVIFNLWKTYRTIYLYAVTFMIYYICFSTYFELYLKLSPFKSEMSDSIASWIKCFFTHFSSYEQDPSRGVDTCGEVPLVRLSVWAIACISLSLAFISVAFFVVTLNSDSLAFWKNVFQNKKWVKVIDERMVSSLSKASSVSDRNGDDNDDDVDVKENGKEIEAPSTRPKPSFNIEATSAKVLVASALTSKPSHTSMEGGESKEASDGNV